MDIDILIMLIGSICVHSNFDLYFLYFCCVTSSLKDAPNMQKLSKGGIPLANGDVFLQKPPPWACPVWNGQDMYHSGYDSRMSRSTSQAIDQAMTQFREAKVKFVRVNLSLEMQSDCMTDFYKQNKEIGPYASKSMDDCGLEWVRVTLTSEPGVSMDDIVDQEPPRRKEHRRVPSTVAIEEVKVTF